MTFNKISLCAVLVLLLSITAYSQTPCKMDGHEIRPTCLPSNGQCPMGFTLVAMTEYSLQCWRPQVQAEVAVKTSLESPATSPQMALNETLEVKKPRMYRKEKKTFLGGRKASIISDVVFIAGTIADAKSTTFNNGYESNPLFQNERGKLASGRYYLIHAGIWGGLKVLERWEPEIANVVKLIFGGAHAVAGVFNFKKGRK